MIFRNDVFGFCIFAEIEVDSPLVKKNFIKIKKNFIKFEIFIFILPFHHQRSMQNICQNGRYLNFIILLIKILKYKYTSKYISNVIYR